jgi:hypothetical protein
MAVAANAEAVESQVESDLHLLVDGLRGAAQGRLFSVIAVGSVGRAHAGGLSTSQVNPQDYDLIAIVEAEETGRIALQRRMQQRLSRLTDDLHRPTSLGVLQRRRLATLTFTLFNYELRHGARILYGQDPSPELPLFHAEQIPLIEATRLLLNRGVLLWGDALRSSIRPPDPAHSAFLHAGRRKAVMGIGDAILIAAGGFHWSYAVRIERARQCEVFDRVSGCDLRELYTRATSEKLGCRVHSSYDGEFPDAVMLLRVHEQVFRLVEEARLQRRLTDWKEYSSLDLLYPRDLRGPFIKRFARLLQAFGPPRMTGFYRRHWNNRVEEVLLHAFPLLAYGGEAADERFVPRALNLTRKSASEPAMVWGEFRRLWREGR